MNQRSSSLLVLVALAAACAKEPVSVPGSTGHTFSITVGQELDLTVGTVGPGQYEAPPIVSSAAVAFLDANIVSPYLPSGPTQLFRFQGRARGIALVTIQHSGNNPTIRDTVMVR